MENKAKIQKEIVDSLPSPCHGLLNIAPRVGKTKIAIDLIKREKPKRILWVTPNTKLRDKDIPDEFVKWKAKTYLKKTVVICWASLENHEGDYDIVILDEYQDITVNNSKGFFNGKIKFKSIICLSGTHPTHRSKNELYQRLGLKLLIEMSIDEARDKNLIAPYEITVVGTHLDKLNKNVVAGNKTVKFMQTEFEKYSYMTKTIESRKSRGLLVPKYQYLNRMRFIHNLGSKSLAAKLLLSKLKGRTLIFCSNIAQAESMCKNTYHSKRDDKDLQLFLQGKIDTLACVNAGGVGFTYENVDNFVILQVNSDSKGDSTQKITRSLVLQEDYIAQIYILVVKDTVDEEWMNKVLLNFDSNVVNYKHIKEYE